MGLLAREDFISFSRCESFVLRNKSRTCESGCRKKNAYVDGGYRPKQGEGARFCLFWIVHDKEDRLTSQPDNSMEEWFLEAVAWKLILRFNYYYYY